MIVIYLKKDKKRKADIYLYLNLSSALHYWWLLKENPNNTDYQQPIKIRGLVCVYDLKLIDQFLKHMVSTDFCRGENMNLKL